MARTIGYPKDAPDKVRQIFPNLSATTIEPLFRQGSFSTSSYIFTPTELAPQVSDKMEAMSEYIYSCIVEKATERFIDGFVTGEITQLENRIALLENTVSEMENEIAFLKERLSAERTEEKTIVLREITKEEALNEIRNLFKKEETLYYSEIAEKLRLDLELVVEICNELMEKGEINIARE